MGEAQAVGEGRWGMLTSLVCVCVCVAVRVYQRWWWGEHGMQWLGQHHTLTVAHNHMQEIGFTVLGLLTFIPGFYHTRLAYYTWRGYPGYRWDSIPGW